MSGSETLIAIGGVTVAADSLDTNALFQSVAATINALPDADKFTFDGNSVPAASSDGHSVLLIPASVSATVNVPDGYAYVVAAQGSHATVVANSMVGPGPPPTVIGDGFTIGGGAGIVASGAGVSSIAAGIENGGGTVIRAAGTATIDAYDRNGSVITSPNSHTTIVASGGGTHGSDALTVGGGATASVTLSLNNGLVIQNGATTTVTLDDYSDDRILIGSFPSDGPTPPPPAPAPPTAPSLPGAHAAPAPVAFTNRISTNLGVNSGFFGPNKYDISDANSVNLISLGEDDVVKAAAGANTIFGASGDSVSVSGGASLLFVGGSGASTVYGDNSISYSGGTPNVTLFATSGQRFELGSSRQNVFVGGTSASTIDANGGGGTFFGGSHGDLYNSGGYDDQTFVGTGGADTIAGGAGSAAPVIYAENGEKMTLTGMAAATVVAFTNGGQVDASRTVANNTFFAGFGGSGNETLIGSQSSFDALGNALQDTFVVGANPNFHYDNPLTITIENWHAGDVFYLTGFPQYDGSDMADAIRNVAGGGALTLSLSDNTRISFVGNHPTSVSGNAAF